jgi:Ran GTPase-activating protein (RanGAP) involved in mRNA processing and transport
MMATAAEDEAQKLCDELAKNDNDFIELDIYLWSLDEDGFLKVIDALKKNTNVVHVNIEGEGTLGIRAAVCLAAVLQEHPSIEKLTLDGVDLVEFSEIALAYKTSKKLNQLSLSGMLMKPCLVESMQSLIEWNALVSLSVEYCHPETSQFIDISQALQSNTSLVDLILDDSSDNPIFSPETVRGIPRLMRRNQGIRNITVWSIDVSPLAMMSIAYTVQQHASLQRLKMHSCMEDMDVDVSEAVALMIQNAPALEELNLSQCTLRPIQAKYLASGLCNMTSVLKKLSLYRCRLNDAGAAHIACALETNRTLKELSLRGNRIGDGGAIALASALKKGSTCTSLSIGHNSIGDKGVKELAEALCSNRTLTDIDLGHNPIGTSGVGHITQMLEANTELKTLRMCGLANVGIRAIVECLSKAPCLENLHLWSTRVLTAETAHSLLTSLEHNTVLKDVDLNWEFPLDFEGKELKSKVNYLLRLNRGGRRALTETSLPPSLWPTILGRSSTDKDVLFFFLREKPDVLIGKSTPKNTRKRKRAESDLDE